MNTLELPESDEVLFMASLMLFYAHWIQDRRDAATEALADACEAHKAMGDERGQALATQMKLLVMQAHAANVEEETD